MESDPELRRVAGIIAKSALEHHAEPTSDYKDFMDFSLPKSVSEDILKFIGVILHNTYDLRSCIVNCTSDQGDYLRLRILFTPTAANDPITGFIPNVITTMDASKCGSSNQLSAPAAPPGSPSALI